MVQRPLEAVFYTSGDLLPPLLRQVTNRVEEAKLQTLEILVQTIVYFGGMCIKSHWKKNRDISRLHVSHNFFKKSHT